MIERVKKTLKDAMLNIEKEYEYEKNKDTVFPDLGVDSIDYVEMVVFCEEELDIEILDLEINWSEINTPSSFIKILLDILNNEK